MTLPYHFIFVENVQENLLGKSIGDKNRFKFDWEQRIINNTEIVRDVCGDTKNDIKNIYRSSFTICYRFCDFCDS